MLLKVSSHSLPTLLPPLESYGREYEQGLACTCKSAQQQDEKKCSKLQKRVVLGVSHAKYYWYYVAWIISYRHRHPKDLLLARLSGCHVFLPPVTPTYRDELSVASGPMRLNTCTPQRKALESLVRMNRSLRTRRIEKSTNFDSTDKMRFLCGVTRSSLLS